MDIALNDLDRKIWEEELADLVPQTVYDAHTHVYDTRAAAAKTEHVTFSAEWSLSTWALLDQADAALFPGRTMHRLAFGNPLQKEGSLEPSHALPAREVARDPASAGLAVVRPNVAPEELAQQLDRHGFLGVKPYRVHAVTGDEVECRITDYFPEAQIEVLDRRGGIVMLHLSKRAAIGDPENLEDLERLTARYPRVQWVLAHCARSYYDRPLLRAAERLRRMPNLWYEISSVCDSDAMDALLSIAGADRVMYGSDDLPVSVLRGKYLTFGHAWCYLNETNHRFDLSHCDGRMTFTRYESLRALGRACRRHGFGRAETERIFCANARRLIEQARAARRA